MRPNDLADYPRNIAVEARSRDALNCNAVAVLNVFHDNTCSQPCMPGDLPPGAC